MKDLIEQLKQNKRPFGLMSEEMQAKMAEIGRSNFEYFSSESVWESLGESDGQFRRQCAYRLRADYTEDEYECIEIEKGVHGLMIRMPTSIVYLHELIDDPNHDGYLHDDGLVYASPIVYSVQGHTNRGYFAPLAALKDGTAHVHKATHVVFKK